MMGFLGGDDDASIAKPTGVQTSRGKDDPAATQPRLRAVRRDDHGYAGHDREVPPCRS